MGIPTLIKTLTASGDSSLSFVHGAADVVFDSTYDEYMFVFTDIGPATDATAFQFQCSIDGGSNYNVTVTNTWFDAYNRETGDDTSLGYGTSYDQAQGTAFNYLARDIGNDADSSAAGTLNIFSPASTTYVKHYYGRVHSHHSADYAQDYFMAGYFNDADDDLNAIQFKMASGNFDGVIQMYGIS